MKLEKKTFDNFVLSVYHIITNLLHSFAACIFLFRVSKHERRAILRRAEATQRGQQATQRRGEARRREPR